MKEPGRSYNQFNGKVKRAQMYGECMQYTQMSKAKLMRITNGNKTGFSTREFGVQ